MDIGHRMKELRIQYGLTQQELADRSELSKGFISQLERNLTTPSIGTLLDITSPNRSFFLLMTILRRITKNATAKSNG